MKERDWETLVWSLQHGSCVLLLGSEIPLPASDGASATLEEDLAQALAGDLTVSRRDLAGIGQQYVAQFGRTDLEREVVRFYESRAQYPSELHSALAGLPLSLVVTSGHDRLLEHALRALGKTPHVEHYHFRGDNEALVATGTSESPLIYHLYGSPREPSSLVVTEGDLLDFLVAVVAKNPPLPSNVRSELKRKGRSFLFVGFGLRHWHLRILLHVLGLSRSESRSFALEPLMAAPWPEREQTVLFYRNGYRIDVYDTNLREFADELRRRIGAEPAPAVPEPAPLAGPQAPKVFICHANEDRDAAQNISAELDRAGLRPWLDRASLQGGDEWDRGIEDAIMDSDYFLVLQSRALLAKSFSYVNREIHLALRRQGYARGGIRFIIPVQVDDAPPLDDLKGIQTIALHGEGSVAELTSIIKRDFQRRARRPS